MRRSSHRPREIKLFRDDQSDEGKMNGADSRNSLSSLISFLNLLDTVEFKLVVISTFADQSTIYI